MKTGTTSRHTCLVGQTVDSLVTALHQNRSGAGSIPAAVPVIVTIFATASGECV